MKTKNVIVKSILGSLVLLLTACNDETPAPPARIVGDVFVRCEKVGDEVMYAPVYYAFSNYAIAKASVTNPSGDGTVDLESYFDSKGIFVKIPKQEDFSTNKVALGNYAFQVITQKGDTLKVEDKLLADELVPLEITEFDYDKEKHSFTIKWNKIEEVDHYLVKLEGKKFGNTFFSSKAIKNNYYGFSPQEVGWKVQNIETDTDCIVKVYAYKYEDSNKMSVYDLNWESIAFKEVKW